MAEEDLDHIPWHGNFVSTIRNLLLQMFGMMYVHHRDPSALIEEFLLNPSIWGEGSLLIYGLCGKQNIGCLGG